MVKKGILSIIGCFIFLALIFSVGSAYALSISDSAAYIDWSNISFTGVPISWLWQESYSEGEAWDDIDYDADDNGAEGWVDTGVIASVPNAEGRAQTTDSEVSERALAQANGLDTEWAYSWALAGRYGAFEALGTGTLTVSVPYSISQTLSTDYPGEYAGGWSIAELGLYNSTTWEYDFDESEADFWHEVEDGDSGNWLDSDTLAVSLWFEQGDEGEFGTLVENDAEVYSEYNEEYVIPEPTSFILLGFGLFGFSLTRKKIKREGR